MPGPGVTIIPCFDPNHPATLKTLPDMLKVEIAFDWLIVRYNPFSFGPCGFNPWLIPALVRARRSTRLAVMFHETCVPLHPLKFTAMFLWQYPQLVALCFAANRVFVPTERWTRELRRCNPKIVPHHLPVGSNLPFCALTKEEARARLHLPSDAVLLGIFGQRTRARCSSGSAQPPVLSIIAFRAPRSFTSVKMVNLYEKPAPGCHFWTKAPSHPAEAALGIRAMDLLLAPFMDGISTRQGSAMSALQHGVPLRSTISKWSDSVFWDWRGPGLSLCNPSRVENYVSCVLALAD
jgi:hypothetical protein